MGAAKARQPVTEVDNASASQSRDKPDQWVLLTWACYYGLRAHFVVRVDDRPRADYCSSSECFLAYKWNSYHAARKFQRQHPKLENYIVFNYSEALRQCDRQRVLDNLPSMLPQE